MHVGALDRHYADVLDSIVSRNHAAALAAKERLQQFHADMSKRGVFERSAATAQIERNLYQALPIALQLQSLSSLLMQDNVVYLQNYLRRFSAEMTQFNEASQRLKDEMQSRSKRLLLLLRPGTDALKLMHVRDLHCAAAACLLAVQSSQAPRKWTWMS